MAPSSEAEERTKELMRKLAHVERLNEMLPALNAHREAIHTKMRGRNAATGMRPRDGCSWSASCAPEEDLAAKSFDRSVAGGGSSQRRGRPHGLDGRQAGGERLELHRVLAGPQQGWVGFLKRGEWGA